MVKLFYKWFIALFKHPASIIKGNFYRFHNVNNDLYIKRYSKCKNCQHKENTPIGEVCGLCGCPLKSKLRVPDEKCELW